MSAPTRSAQPATAAPPEAPTAAASRWGGVTLFSVLTGLYFAVGCVLVLRYNLLDPDSPSRVANADYVTNSRHPHLSAVGFVWNPLPSMVEIPILQLAPWFPALRTHGLAGVVQSALFMAGAAVQVRRIALDRGIGAGWRRVAVGCFALQPMIIVYGASGMSEAAEVFCLLWCTRRLLRWTEHRHVFDLALAGLALGVGYLARYEVIPAAVGAALFVAILAGVREAPAARIQTALAHVAVVMLPVVCAAAAWALTGWVINQELFATVTSRYGNVRQVAGAVRRGGFMAQAASDDWVVISARLFGMQPFAGIAAAGSVVAAVITRRPALLVPIVTFGPVLVFAAWGQFTSMTFGWFRFYLLAVPMVVCIGMVCWTTLNLPRPPWKAETALSRVGATLLALSIAVGFPVTVRASLNHHIGNQQLQFGFKSLLNPDLYPPEEQWYRRLLVNDRVMADYLDRLQLPAGSVLMDTFNTWGVWLNSDRPEQFVITSDYDFKAALNRPQYRGIKYILVSNPASTDPDLVNSRYPSLWSDGANIAELVYSIYGATGDERFRLYRVNQPHEPGAPINVAKVIDVFGP